MPKYNINLYQYNNYSDRILKKEDDLYDYGEPVASVEAMNFNFGDGVDTTHVIDGFEELPTCNYAIVFEAPDTIISRWFIMENDYISNRKFKVKLHRDVVADNWDSIISADAFIQKATVSDDSPFIYNQEGVTTNQIKSSEVQIKDETGIGWLLVYLAKDYAGGDVDVIANVVPDYTVTGLGELSQIIGMSPNSKAKKVSTKALEFKIAAIIEHTPIVDYHKFTFRLDLQATTPRWRYTDEGSITEEQAIQEGINVAKLGINYTRDKILIALNTHTSSSVFIADEPNHITDTLSYNTTIYNNILNNTDKAATITTGSDAGDWRVNVSTGNTYSNYNVLSGDTTYNMLNTALSSLLKYTLHGVYYQRTYAYSEYNLVALANGDFKITMPSSDNRFHCKDLPYDMFCIPYGDIVLKNSKDATWTDLAIDKSTAMSIAQGLCTSLDANKYDCQLVPYCPMTGFNIGEGYIDINTTSTKRYTKIQRKVGETYTDVCLGLWCTAAKGSKNIPLNITVNNKKIENQCDMYRLCCPNWNGQFEFNAARNDGVDLVKISYTYLPTKPFIKAEINFKNLYGTHNDDGYGMICGGDFSIAYTSDAWQSYQVQNKNYAEIFNRQIENMDTNRKYNRISEAASTVASSLAVGGAAGIATGSVGLGIGAGVASLGAGIADMYVSDKLFQESKAYATDTHNMQLDNMRALPQSLTSIGAYNNINKIFVTLEKYTCTDAEKNAFANKIRNEGMTLGVYGTIQEYINNSWSYNNITDRGFIKADIINLSGITDDDHLVNAIKFELNRGVYTK